MRITVSLCVLFVVIVVGVFIYSVSRTPVLSDEALRQKGVFVWPTPKPLRPFQLTTTAGEPFTLDDLRGTWTFIYFGFTHCPDVCPTTLSALAGARQRLARKHPQALKDFQVVLVTVDPERDDARNLAEYVHAFSPAFVGVRGSRAATAGLASQVNVVFGKVPADGGGYDVQHSTNIVIVDPQGDYHAFAKTPHEADTIVAAFLSLRARFH